MTFDAPERTRLLEAAIGCFAAEGFDATTMQRIAGAASLPLETAFLHYPSKHAFALALYQGLVEDTRAAVADLPRGTVAERFGAILDRKLDRLDAHRSAMRALLSAAVDAKGPVGVLSSATAAIRARMSGAFHAAVVGATDAPADASKLSALLYGVHLAVVLLWTQDDRGEMARAAVGLCKELLSAAAPLLALPLMGERLGRLEAVFGDRLSPVVTADVEQKARWILARLMRGRRLFPPAEGEPARTGDEAPTEEELAPHLPLVRSALTEGRRLLLLLPAFPAKSPNPQKVLGKLPDMAERVALRSLQTLCEELAEAHPGGVELVLCSDGLVFADVVGVPDDDVTAYGAEIDRLLAELPLLRRFDLAHAFGAASPAEARQRLFAGWAESDPDLTALVASSRSLAAQLDGLHRFMFEDGIALFPDKSRTQVRKEARPRAFEVLRRSRAWGRLLSAFFPEAVRLSIHPQPPVSEKIGVHLLPTHDAWLTPWHGVALLEDDRFRLVKRADAEALGASAVSAGDRPSHYRIDRTGA
jgi:pyoverdine/dityrosine biosynthesis protein Dit1/AcrR family transcriptional regulator